MTRHLLLTPAIGALVLLAGCEVPPAEQVGGPGPGEVTVTPHVLALHEGPGPIPLTVDYEVVNGRIFLPPDDPDYPSQCREIDGWDQGFIFGDNNDDHGVFRFGDADQRGNGFTFVSLSSTDCVDVRDLTLHGGLSVLTFPGLHDSRLTLWYSGRVTGGMPGAFTFEATGTLGAGTGVLKCARGRLSFTGHQNGDGTSSYLATGDLRMGCG